MDESAAQVERHDSMTGRAIEGRCIRMTGVTRRGTAAIKHMAGSAGYSARGSHDVRIAVVGISAEKGCDRMAKSAFGAGHRVGAGRRVVRGRGFAPGHGTVVATGARPGNPCVIEAAVRVQRDEAGGIVAIVALGIRRRMKLGFADRLGAVMALTAVSKHLQVIDIGGDIPGQRGMTGFAQVAGGDVILRLGRDRAEVVVMTVPTTGR